MLLMTLTICHMIIMKAVEGFPYCIKYTTQIHKSPESIFWQEVDLYLKHDQQPEPLYSFRDFLQTVLNRPSE